MSKDEKKAEENQNNRLLPILAAADQAGLIEPQPAEEMTPTSKTLMSRIGQDSGALTGPRNPTPPRDASIQASQTSDMVSYPQNLTSGVEKNTRSPTATPDLAKGDQSTAPLQFGERPAQVPSRATGDPDLVVARGDQTRTINADKKRR